ncbi:protein SOB FIVE-LIKE 5-like [Salvia splendens]|uniref:protein SOB FIVE-LIKE 5-like n=1 Tax=Salvia splendens TaxID=180675 RepID=UPI001C2744E2|nr:protein SOB FIVE-LIKE 5-like isoform X2 [Salvia splendens]XP_042044764.1 protein SOB FIVE-LIKE 5-like [Salvia splendens]
MNYIFENEECSSGCESGWTLYFQQSYKSKNDSPEPRTKRSTDEDEEDLSMVSDASSGPPQVYEEEGNDTSGCFFNNYATVTEPLSERKKNRGNRCRKKVPERSSLLEVDDTASSSLYGYCNKTRSQASVENVVEYSQGYSSTQFEVRPTYVEEHYDFLQSGNHQLQQQNQWFEGKRW